MRRSLSMWRVLMLLSVLGLTMGSVVPPGRAASQDLGDHYDCSYCQPEQVHIAFGEKTNDIVVTWNTEQDPLETTVEYGESELDTVQHGNRVIFVDGGDEKRSQFIHRVTLTDLKHDTQYVYHVGSVFGWSDEFHFHTPRAGADWPLRALVYGDMGSVNAHSLSYLQEETQRGAADVVVHVGDFAYDMDSDNARVGDQFMRQIQPIAAELPYMVCPGNHEEKYNFSNYRNRFSMPGGTESLYYSWDLGPIHFVSLSTEFYYHLTDWEQCNNQYKWFVDDLKKANKKENRAKRPWIIVYGHRPMYCSSLRHLSCKYEFTRISDLSLEPPLAEYGVDVVIWGHEHSYERTWPLYNSTVYNGTEGAYINPGAPVHVITGSAGCKEDTNRFSPNPAAWSAFRSSHYGYTRMVAHNHTHLSFEQVDVEANGTVIDSFLIVKNKHAAYRFD